MIKLMTAEQAAKTLSVLERKLKGCPVCGSEKLMTGGMVEEEVVTSQGDRTGCTITLLQVTCCDCSYVLYFAGAPLGIE